MKIDKENKLKLFFGGDVCISSPISSDFISNELANQIKNNDFRVINWEAPIIKSTDNKSKKAGPSIFQNSTYSSFLEKNLFNVFSLANNHIMDYGENALKNTINILEQCGTTFGASPNYDQIYKPLILDKNGIKVALISCGEAQFGCAKSEETQGGFAWVFSPQIPKLIRELKSKVNFIVVVPHAGLEMEELPLPEWRSCYKNLIDLGADLIVASHPHVIQPKEKYKDKYIYYSLGNFLFNSANKHPKWGSSLALNCEFIIDENREKSIEIKEIFCTYKKNILQIDNSLITNFTKMNNELINHTYYLNKINQICVDHWNDYYESYFFYERNNIRYTEMFKNLPDILKKIIQLINHRFLKVVPNKNKTMVYHNIAIETNRFAVERAIKLIESLS